VVVRLLGVRELDQMLGSLAAYETSTLGHPLRPTAHAEEVVILGCLGCEQKSAPQRQQRSDTIGPPVHELGEAARDDSGMSESDCSERAMVWTGRPPP
jgi:hypothetical protein